MKMEEIINIILTILSALFAGASFTFYKKTVNIYGDKINSKKIYKGIKQESGENGKNVVGDGNKL